jgi:YgiT-type zinc finger domain-containing protein
MKAKKCPICGKLGLHHKRGDYHMELPPNISGDALVVADAEWMHCESCGEDILSRARTGNQPQNPAAQALSGCVSGLGRGRHPNRVSNAESEA